MREKMHGFHKKGFRANFNASRGVFFGPKSIMGLPHGKTSKQTVMT